MKPLVIFGSGAVGRLAAQIVADINRHSPKWNLRGFVDDTTNRPSASELPLLGGADWLLANSDHAVAVAIGDPASRASVVKRLRAQGFVNFATLVHPTCWISERVTVETGCILYPGVTIDPDVRLGEFTIVNKSATLGHDAEIGAFTTIGPGVNLGGRIRVGAGVFFGINSCTIQGIEIGEGSTIGAGAVVAGEIPPRLTVVGRPARPVGRGVAAQSASVRPVPQDLVIVGAGGAGVEAAWVASQMIHPFGEPVWNVRGFLDDAPELHGTKVSGLKVLGGLEAFLREPGAQRCSVHVAIGSNEIRRRVAQAVEVAGFSAATLIAPTAVIAPSASIGVGSYIGHQAFVGPEAQVGMHVLVNVQTSIGHHARLGDFSQVSPGARISGNVVLETGVFLGSNAVVTPGQRVGEWSTIGASSMVSRDVPPRVSALGVPARVIAALPAQ